MQRSAVAFDSLLVRWLVAVHSSDPPSLAAAFIPASSVCPLFLLRHSPPYYGPSSSKVITARSQIHDCAAKVAALHAGWVASHVRSICKCGRCVYCTCELLTRSIKPVQSCACSYSLLLVLLHVVATSFTSSTAALPCAKPSSTKPSNGNDNNSKKGREKHSSDSEWLDRKAVREV